MKKRLISLLLVIVMLTSIMLLSIAADDLPDPEPGQITGVDDLGDDDGTDGGDPAAPAEPALGEPTPTQEPAVNIQISPFSDEDLKIQAVSRAAMIGGIARVDIKVTENPLGVSRINALRIDLPDGLTIHFPQGKDNYNPANSGSGTWPFVPGSVLPMMGRPSTTSNPGDEPTIGDDYIIFSFQDPQTVDPYNRNDESFTLVTVLLKVPDGAAEGTVYNVELSVEDHEDKGWGYILENGEISDDFLPELIDGTVTVSGNLPVYDAAELEAVLRGTHEMVGDSDVTIVIGDDISLEVSDDIIIENRDITINLNSKTVSISNSREPDYGGDYTNALDLRYSNITVNGLGTMTVTGDYAMGLTSSEIHASSGAVVNVFGTRTGAIYADEGSTATITTATAEGLGVYAGYDSNVTVTGNVTSSSWAAVIAQNGGEVTVGGNVTGNNYCGGIEARGGTVTVAGSVTAINSSSAYAENGGEIYITGDANGRVRIDNRGKVEVGGSVYSTDWGAAVYADGEGSRVEVTGDAIGIDGGAEARGGAEVIIKGDAECTGVWGSGVDAHGQGTYVEINGDVITGGEYSDGAYAQSGAVIVVKGNAIASGALSNAAASTIDGGKVYVFGSLQGNICDVNIFYSDGEGGTGGNRYSADIPSRQGAILRAPFDGYYWDEFKAPEWVTWDDGAVYKRQGVITPTEFPVANASQLQEAIDTIGNEQSGVFEITLTASILDFTNQFIINGNKFVTLNLGTYNLTINYTPDEYNEGAIELDNGAWLTVNGTGTLTATGGSGINAYNGSELAKSNTATINVHGNNGAAAFAGGGAIIHITNAAKANVDSSGGNIYATGSSKITVDNNVTGGWVGAIAQWYSIVDIGGNVTSTDGSGVSAMQGSVIYVTGNINGEQPHPDISLPGSGIGGPIGYSADQPTRKYVIPDGKYGDGYYWDEWNDEEDQPDEVSYVYKRTTAIPANTYAGINTWQKFAAAIADINNKGDGTYIIDITGGFTYEYYSVLEISGNKNITINLNGNYVWLNNHRGTALYLEESAVLTIDAGGELIIYGQVGIETHGTGTAFKIAGGSQVHVHTSDEALVAFNGSSITVTNASSDWRATVSADGSGSTINVRGNVYTDNGWTAITAYNDSFVTVDGDVYAYGANVAVMAQIGSKITVKGNVESNGWGGVQAVGDGANATVYGNVTTHHDAGYGLGLAADQGGTVYLFGQVFDDFTDEFDGKVRIGGWQGATSEGVTYKDIPVSNPTYTQIEHAAPYHGYYWNQYSWADEPSTIKSHVYIRTGGVPSETYDNVSTSSELYEALTGGYIETIINITGPVTINSDEKITISGNRDITINLNGNTVNINYTGDVLRDGFEVRDNAKVTVNGPGTLNLSGDTGLGVTENGAFYITGGAAANTTANRGSGVYAANNSYVEITNVTSNDSGISAQGGTVVATGIITVAGDNWAGVVAQNGGKVYLTGDIVNLNTSGSNDIVVGEWNKNTDVYFNFGEPVKQVQLPAPYNGLPWDEYSNASKNPSVVSYVYVRQGQGPSIPANKASYNLGMLPGGRDVVVEGVNLGFGTNAATDITSIELTAVNGVDLPSPEELIESVDYAFSSVSGNLTIYESYLESYLTAVGEDEVTLTVTFDNTQATQAEIIIDTVFDNEIPNTEQSVNMTGAGAVDIDTIFGDGDDVTVKLGNTGTGMAMFEKAVKIELQMRQRDFGANQSVDETNDDGTDYEYNPATGTLTLYNTFLTGLWSGAIEDAAGHRLVLHIDFESYDGTEHRARVNIDLVDSARVPSITPPEEAYDITSFKAGVDNYADVTFNADIGAGRFKATDITSVTLKGGAALTEGTDYVYNALGKRLTIKGSYLDSLTEPPAGGDILSFDVLFDDAGTTTEEIEVRFVARNYRIDFTPGSERLIIELNKAVGDTTDKDGLGRTTRRLYAIGSNDSVTALTPNSFILPSRTLDTTAKYRNATEISVNITKDLNSTKGETLYIVLDPVAYAAGVKGLSAGAAFQKAILKLIEDGVIKVIPLQRYATQAQLRAGAAYNYNEGRLELGDIFKNAPAVAAGTSAAQKSGSGNREFNLPLAIDSNWHVKTTAGAYTAAGSKVFVRTLPNDDQINPIFASAVIEIVTVRLTNAAGTSGTWNSALKVGNFVKFTDTGKTDRYGSPIPVWAVPDDTFEYRWYRVGSKNAATVANLNSALAGTYEDDKGNVIAGEIVAGEPIPDILFNKTSTGNNIRFRIVRLALPTASGTTIPQAVTSTSTSTTTGWRIPAVTKAPGYPKMNLNNMTFAARLGQEYMIVDIADMGAGHYTAARISAISRAIMTGDELPDGSYVVQKWTRVNRTAVPLQEIWAEHDEAASLGRFIFLRTAATASTPYSLTSVPARNNSSNITTAPIRGLEKLDAETIGQVLSFNTDTGVLSISRNIPKEYRWLGYTTSSRINVSGNSIYSIEAANRLDLRYLMVRIEDDIYERTLYEVYVQIQGNVKGSVTSQWVRIHIDATTGEIIKTLYD